MHRLLLLAVACLALGSTLFAHDFWIEPETFTPKSGELLRVRLKVGDFGRGDNVPRSEQRLVRFELVAPDETKPLVGREGQEVAGVARLESDGTTLVGYVSNHAFVELEPAKFATYLEEKGLDAVAELRRTRGETQQAARELYSRSCKALLSVGGKPSEGFDRVMDLPLELIPNRNPSALAKRSDGAGFEALPLTLHFERKPLAGALVAALCLDETHTEAGAPLVAGTDPTTTVFASTDPSATLFARTDSEGRVSLALPRAGRWLIAAVHMRPAGANEHQADWESFWGSLTFEIPAAGGSARR